MNPAPLTCPTPLVTASQGKRFGNDNAGGPESPSGQMNQDGLRIQELVGKIDAFPDAEARELMHECITSLLSFYGEGLERILQLIRRAGINGQGIHDELIQDKIVSALLLIHGLHPVDLETRLHQALEKVRPYMESHGGNVELLSLENDVARLRLQGTCKTCPASSVTLELAVRHAIEEACPDLLGFELEP
jgi:Fe-S cluster biogenesis protein NfuA